MPCSAPLRFWRLDAAMSRILLSLSVLCVAFVCLVQTTQVDAKLGPSEGGTYGRSLEDWGGFLSPALVELREDALRRYQGRPTEPGGPLYDPDQILSSFSVRGLDGWHLLYAAVVVLFFAAGLATVRRLVRRPFLALVITSTAGLVISAATVDGAGQCNADAGECYRASRRSWRSSSLLWSGASTPQASASAASSAARSPT